jgi:tetratricopeptide (TPR) repeat protein/AraC-like DNA-binding protein
MTCSHFKNFRVKLLIGLIWFTVTSLFSNAQTPDSAALFSRLGKGNDALRINTLEKIYSEYYRNDPAKGYPYMLQAIALAGKLGDRTTLAKAYYRMSFYFSVTSRYDSALYYARMGLEISEQLNSKFLIAKGYCRLGNHFRQVGRRTEAAEWLKKSIQLDSSNADQYASCSFGLGMIYGDAGCGEESVYYYLQALRVREKLKQLADAGYILCNLSGFYFESSDETQWVNALEKAVSLFRQAKNPRGEAYADNIMGSNYAAKQDYRQALFWFRKSLAINILDTISLRSSTVFNLVNIGDCWLKLGRFDSAGIYYNMAQVVYGNDRDPIPGACIWLSMGELNTKLRNYSKAIEYLNKGLDYSRMAHFRANLPQAYTLLSECYTAMGRHDKALEYLKKRNMVNDSMVTAKAKASVANMMFRYETEKKNKQITLLREEASQQKSINRTALLVIIILLLITAVATYLIWRYYKTRLRPKVQTLDFIQENINIKREGDNRRLKALENILPPELKPFPVVKPDKFTVNQELLAKLETSLVQEKIYLDENLTLADTAKLLETNTAYLSRLINEHYNINFSALLNKYRVEEAKKLMRSGRHASLSMEGIAKSSGFRSRSTFNQAFKSQTGKTPSEYTLGN